MQQSTHTKSQAEVTAELRERAAKNEIFNAICYVFAKRQRTRRMVTVSALKQAMEHEGADFDRKEYEDSLKFLAYLGLGRPKINAKGQFVGLADIKATLQSIGQAAAAKRPDLEKFNVQTNNHYIDLTKPEPVEASQVITTKKHVLRKASEAKKAEMAQKPTLPQSTQATDYEYHLTIMINGAPARFPGGKVKAADLAEFLSNFQLLNKRHIKITV